MNSYRLVAPAMIALASLVLGAVPAGAQLKKEYRGSLAPEEFREIHGTTDRYELLAKEIKGDCTACHKRRSETDVKVGAGFLYRREDGGGETLRPYDDLDSHPEALFDVYFRNPEWGRVHATGEYLGGTDHTARVDARYQTMVNATVTSQGFPHNQEHLTLPGPSGETPVAQFNPDDQDPGADYRKDLGEQTLRVIAGLPQYPAHVRVRARRWTVGGEAQQIFVDENCTTNCHDISQTRDLDSTTTEVGAGADAHLGYGMVSYAYDYTQFRDDEDDPEHTYGAVDGVSAGGVSAHNTYPDARLWEHRVRVSTTQTGQITASAGLHLGRVENEDSDVARDYYRGEADVTWTPWSWVTALVRYRRTHKEDDVPDAAAALRETAGLPAEYGEDEDRYAASLSVRPIDRLTLRGDVVRTERVSDEADGFRLPSDSRKTEWKASAFYRPVRRVNLRASYSALKVDDEAVERTDPTQSRRWQAWASAQPWSFLSVNASYSGVSAENEDFDRDEDRSVLQAGITVMPVASVAVGGFYSRFCNEVTAAVTSVSEGVKLRVDGDTPYEALGTQYGVFADWRPLERLTLRGQWSILRAKGSFETGSATFGDLGAFSDFDARQQDLAVDLGYEWESGWGVTTRFEKSDYAQEGAIEEEDEDVLEGKLILSKRW